MKRIFAVIMILCISLLSGCGKETEEAQSLGINAEIVEINRDDCNITVKDDGKVFGEECVIDCTDIPIIYCNYETQDLKDIEFEELQSGDRLIFTMYQDEVENAKDGSAEVLEIQLSTQRMN